MPSKEAEMEKPVATSTKVKGRWIMDQNRPNDPDAKVKQADYTRRSSHCLIHKNDQQTRQRPSSDFVGEVEGGWVFFCNQEGYEHYFAATPPA